MKRAMCAVIVIMASGKLASAQGDTAGPQPAAPESPKSFTLSWSPLHLALPLIELEGEYNVAPHMGAGVILGGGRVTSTSSTGPSITATAYEVGAQFNYYIMHAFDGLHVGLEGMYLTLGDVMQDSSVTAEGLAIGPYVGYKLQTSIGFAFIAQLGAQYAVAQAESSSSGAMASAKKLYPLLNLNVGWSF